MIENEKVLERKLCKAIKDMGGRAYKFVSPNQRGVPDRLCILPKGISFFVELKTTGKKPTKLQVLCMNELENMGQICHVVDSSESLKALLDRQQYASEDYTFVGEVMRSDIERWEIASKEISSNDIR